MLEKLFNVLMFISIVVSVSYYHSTNSQSYIEVRERVKREILSEMQKEISVYSVGSWTYIDPSGKCNIIVFKNVTATYPSELGTFQITNGF